MLTIAALAWGYHADGATRRALAGGGAAGLALLAHTAQRLLLAPTLVLFVGRGRWRDRARLPAVAGWAGGGLAIGFLTFYQFSAGHVFTRLLPQIVDKLRKGGGVGKGADHLGAPLLSGFGPQIEAHFAPGPCCWRSPPSGARVTRAADQGHAARRTGPGALARRVGGDFRPV